MRIQVNGEPREVDDELTISGLLALLEVQTPLVAVERNRQIVTRSQHGSTRLVEGDQIEIVTLVGGG